MFMRHGVKDTSCVEGFGLLASFSGWITQDIPSCRIVPPHGRSTSLNSDELCMKSSTSQQLQPVRFVLLQEDK
jgi:hypothetical protein